MSNEERDIGAAIGTAIGAIILGVLGGLALKAVVDYIGRPKCPVCERHVRPGVNQCPKCHTVLRWE